MFCRCILLFLLFPMVLSVTQEYKPILGDFDTWVSEDDNIKYEPKRYDINYNITDLQEEWALTTYSKIAEEIIMLTRQSLPYDVLRELIYSLTSGDKISTDDFNEKISEFELPYLVMAGFPLCLAIIVPCGGIIFCVKTCGRKSKRKKLDEFDVIHNKHLIRFISASMVLTAATLILIGAIACFFASDRIDAGIELGNKMTETTLDNTITFANNTVNALEHLLREDFEKATGHGNHILKFLPHRLADGTASGILKRLHGYFDSLEKFDAAVQNLTDSISSASTQRELILSLSGTVSTKVTNLHNEIELILAECDRENYPPCGQFQTFDWNIRYTGEFSHLPDLKQAAQSLVTLQMLDLNQIVNVSYNEVYALRSDLLEVAGDAFHVLENVTFDVNKEKDALWVRLEEVANLVINDTLIPIKLDLVSARKDAWFTSTEALFSLLLKIPCFVMFVMSFMLFLALSLGQFAVIHAHIWAVDELSPTMKMARTAKDLILSFLWIFFVLSFFIHVLLAVTIWTGSNMTHVCHGLKDNSIIEQIIDNNETWGGKNLLGSFIHQNPQVDLKLSEVFSKCKEGSSVWKAIDLNLMFDTSGISNLQKKFYENIPPLDDILRYNISSGDNYLPAINITEPHTYGFFLVNKTSIIQSTMSVNFDWDEAISYLRDLHREAAYHSPQAVDVFLTIKYLWYGVDW